MNQLIQINTNNPDRPTVSGRALHAALEVETPYHKWFPRMCEYGFRENEDFAVTDIFVRNPAGGPQTQKDAAITIDMAKEICMLQRTERGKQFRQYFIKVEEAWNTPEMIVARAQQILQTRLDEAKSRVLQLESTVEAMQPKVLFADAVSASNSSILVGVLAKILKQNGYKTGQNRFFEELRNDGWLISQEGSNWNMPTQKSMERGLFEIKETTVTHPDGHISISKTVKVTGKGQVFFIDYYLHGGKEKSKRKSSSPRPMIAAQNPPALYGGM